MRKEIIATLLVAMALAGGAAGYLVGVNTAGNHTGTNTTTNSGVSTTICTITAQGQVLLQVLNSTTGKPIPSAPVQGQVTPVPCGSNPQTTIALNTTLTNSTGYALFGVVALGEYHLTLYAYGNYAVDVRTNPEQTTCVTLSIPSGETVIKYSGIFQFSC